jgi:hypothetical protein
MRLRQGLCWIPMPLPVGMLVTACGSQSAHYQCEIHPSMVAEVIVTA